MSQIDSVAVDKLHDMLKKVQEPKGFFFNWDKAHVTGLLEALIINKDRYGYMCCPCRLAMGDRRMDADIICPCKYRDDDVAQYGACYCSLYVSKEFNESKQTPPYVPERRDPVL